MTDPARGLTLMVGQRQCECAFSTAFRADFTLTTPGFSNTKFDRSRDLNGRDLNGNDAIPFHCGEVWFFLMTDDS
jgi:hypothetical protein